MRVNAKRLREARKRRGLSPTELRQLAGTSVSHVSPEQPCNSVRLTLQPMRAARAGANRRPMDNTTASEIRILRTLGDRASVSLEDLAASVLRPKLPRSR